nr:hypothetical protein [uncultured Caldimonas sp.]
MTADLAVFMALENERCLDLRFREVHGIAARVPNFKVMKQLALQRQLGLLYGPVVWLGMLLVPAYSVLAWLPALMWAIASRHSQRCTGRLVFATTPLNEQLIRAVLSESGEHLANSHSAGLLSVRRICAAIGVSGVFKCIALHLRLYKRICAVHDRAKRSDLLLHSIDSFRLLLLSSSLQAELDLKVVTDDHHQRWVFLLSHYCGDLYVVQHGRVDASIEFPNRYGRLHVLYARDEESAAAFGRYFEIGKVELQRQTLPLTPNEFSSSAIFLASSFPWIDDEIELVRRLKVKSGRPILVKFHPAHRYDGRMAVLSGLATHVCSPEERPECKLFVSHSSSMEEEYRAHAIPTVSIAEAGSVDRAVDEVMLRLSHAEAASPRGPACSHSEN